MRFTFLLILFAIACIAVFTIFWRSLSGDRDERVPELGAAGETAEAGSANLEESAPGEIDLPQGAVTLGPALVPLTGAKSDEFLLEEMGVIESSELPATGMPPLVGSQVSDHLPAAIMPEDVEGATVPELLPPPSFPPPGFAP